MWSTRGIHYTGVVWWEHFQSGRTHCGGKGEKRAIRRGEALQKRQHGKVAELITGEESRGVDSPPCAILHSLGYPISIEFRDSKFSDCNTETATEIYRGKHTRLCSQVPCKCNHAKVMKVVSEEKVEKDESATAFLNKHRCRCKKWMLVAQWRKQSRCKHNDKVFRLISAAQFNLAPLPSPNRLRAWRA